MSIYSTPCSSSTSSNVSSSTSSSPVEYDFIIIGAGISGAALASVLGRDKHRYSVLVLERDLSEPDRIVGELLQPGGVQILNKMGLAETLEDIDAQTILGYAVFRGAENLVLTYPQSMTGVSFHHGRFVQNLRKAAQTAGDNVVCRQGTVTKLVEDKDGTVRGVRYKVKGEKAPRTATAHVTIVCDGCFSRFRKKLMKHQKPEGSSSFVGLVLKDAPLPHPNRGHVVLAEPSPVLAYPISSNEIRVLVDVPNPLPSSSNGDLAKYLLEVTLPQIPENLQTAFEHAVKETRIRSMPNNRLHPEQFEKRGLIALGDAINMRHPLTGGGMTVAFSDVLIVTQLLSQVKDLSDTDAIAKVQQKLYKERHPLASTINVLAQALYEVFADVDDVGLQEACFNYFKMGGIAVSGPMGLLAGLTPNPKVLITHFFAAALYGVGQQLLPLPLPWKIPKAYKIMSKASSIVTPLLKNENVLIPKFLQSKL